ncbi:MAG: hypothetical protein ACLUGB_04010 [Bacilli bacterium]
MKRILSMFLLSLIFQKNVKVIKKAYNDYCNISEQSREKYNIEVKEYKLDNNKNIINTKNNDSMEL